MEETENRRVVDDVPDIQAADIGHEADHADQAPNVNPEGEFDFDSFQPPEDEPDFDELDQDYIDEIMRDEAEGDRQYGMDIDLLLSLGVEPVDACRFMNKSYRKVNPVTFVEAYGRGGLTNEAARNPLGTKGLRSLDFACLRPNGERLDLSRATDRREAMELVESDDPDWVIGSPPCTSFSLLNRGLNYPKMDKDVVAAKIKEGLVHLRFVCALYRRQMRRGKWFLHEHPKTAASWHCPYIKRLLKLEGVGTTTCDQCMFGLVTPDDKGVPTPAKKTTQWMSNSQDMLDVLTRKCDKSHHHQHLLGGRAAAAAFDPPALLRAILKGMALTRDHAMGSR